MLVFLLLYISALFLLLGLLMRAPRGWQDEDGFHFGVPPGVERLHDEAEALKLPDSCE
jgi:hypothetical protein